MNPEGIKLIRYTALAFGLLVVVLLIVYVFTHKFVSFAVANPDGIDNISVTVTDEKDKSVPSLFGIHIIDRSQQLVVFTTKGGEQTTLPTEQLGRFAANVAVTLHKLRDVSILSSESLGCNTYDTTTQRVLSQRCATAATSMYQLDTSTMTPWQNVQIQRLTRGITYHSYGNGVIALTSADASERVALVYTRQGMTHFPLGDTASIQVDTDIATDTTNQSNGSFLVFSPSTGNVTYYAITNGTIEHTREAKLDDYDKTTTRSRCILVETTGYCLTGAFRSALGHEESTSTADVDSVISVIDFAQEKPAVRRITLDKSLTYANDIYTDASKAIYVLNDHDLYRLNDTRTQLIRPETDSVSGGTSLIYTTNAGVYRVNDDATSTRLIDKRDYNISTLNAYGAHTLFDVRTTDNRLFTNGITLEISDAPRASNTSALALLGLLKDLPVQTTAIANNRVQIMPQSFYTTDRATGTFSYDQAEYDKNKTIILDQLNAKKADGTLPSTLDILFAQ